MTSWWVVTDLDGTLLDHTYDWQPAAACLNRLRQLGIPVIPCTSKTAEEVRRFRLEAGLSDPFIVENGGAVHGGPPEREWQLVLGRPSTELLAELAHLSAQLKLPLRALSDCSVAEVERLTGLRGHAARLAMDRQWSTPFLPPPTETWSALRQTAEARGLQVVMGNRLAHLLARSSDKGLALAALRDRCGPPDLRVLGLGDSPNDIPMLQAVDVAVVVPGAHGPHPDLRGEVESGHWQLAPAPHAEGWARAVNGILNLKPPG